MAFTLGFRQLFPVKISAIYPTKEAANDAMTRLKPDNSTGSSVFVVGPSESDDQLAKRLERRDWKRGGPFVKAHFMGGLCGAVLGAAVGSVFIVAGPELTRNNPYFTLPAFTYIFFMLGLFAAGFFAFRMDQDNLTYKSLDAKHDGNWVVIFQTLSKREAGRADEVLQAGAKAVLRTF